MKRYYIYFALFGLFLLSACGTSANMSDSHSAARSALDEQPIEPEPPIPSRYTMKTDDFIFTLFSKQETYEANEKVHVFAELTYVGDKETIEIVHGEPLIAFSLQESTRDIKLDMLIREIAATSKLAKNKPLLVKFDIENSFLHANDERSKQFYDTVKQSGLLTGEYVIKSSAHFFMKDDKHLNLSGIIGFSIKNNDLHRLN